MSAKTDKSQLLSFLIEEIDKETIKGTLEKNYQSILEDGRAVGISSYTTILLAKTAVLRRDKFPEVEPPILPASFVYTHLPSKEKDTIEELETEVRRLKKSPIVKKQRGRTAFLIISIVLFGFSSFMFLAAFGLAAGYNEVSECLSSTIDSLNVISNKATILEKDKTILSDKLQQIGSFKYVVGSSRRPKDPSTDNHWVEWIEVEYPVRIESFYTFASKSGQATVVAYDAAHQKIVETTISLAEKQWQEIKLKDFKLTRPGRYYLCIENTSNTLSYHSTNNEEYLPFKEGPLRLIGATSKDSAKGESPSIGTGYYQYFYSIKYSLL